MNEEGVEVPSKRYSMKFQVFEKKTPEGMLIDVVEVLVAADTIEEGRKQVTNIILGELSGKHIRLASVVEFAAVAK